MPPFFRSDRLWGWDWTTPKELRHLPWQLRDRLVAEARAAADRHPVYTRVYRGACLLFVALFFLPVVYPLIPALSPFLGTYLWLVVLAAFLGAHILKQSLFRRLLRQKLTEAGHRPRYCFECGYYLEGFEGNECPGCDTALAPLRPHSADDVGVPGPPG